MHNNFAVGLHALYIITSFFPSPPLPSPPLVPPIISSSPPPTQSVTRNRPLSLEVKFRSRLQENTVVTWFHDGEVIPSNRIQTEYLTEAPNAVTQLSFDPILRRDSGVYRVVIRNNFHLIPSDMNEVETSFQVDVEGEPLSLVRFVCDEKIASSSDHLGGPDMIW